MKSFEVNFDGIVGPTHNYAGLSYGNVASLNNASSVANPREAILQGLEKMKALSEMGVKQGFLPPHERPYIPALKAAGFSGTDSEILAKAYEKAPGILNAFSSASPMWTANAATVSPSADSKDKKVHFTPANLINKLHRSIESDCTGKSLKAIFSNDQYFRHHSALPYHEDFGDEGAANHTRLCNEYNEQGLQIFVYGRQGAGRGIEPKKFPARQTLMACEAVARSHELRDEHVVYLQQNPNVIDEGVFHNDVISVGNRNVFFYHEMAFLNSEDDIQKIKSAYHGDLKLIKVPLSDVSVEDAVKSYLFNSQLVWSEGKTILIAPTDCEENANVKTYIEKKLSEKQGIDEVKFFKLKQSMQNGGGPACLRLRVALNENEFSAINQKAVFSAESYERLKAWANKHYRDRLVAEDLKDPSLLNECRSALDELTQIMGLGSIYYFQR